MKRQGQNPDLFTWNTRRIGNSFEMGKKKKKKDFEMYASNWIVISLIE